MTARRPWSDADIATLRELYASMPTPALAARLGRTVTATRSRAKLLRINRGARRVWTAAERAALIDRYPHEPTKALARSLGRSVSKIYAMAQKLGLAKSEAYLASPDACRLRREDNVGAAHRFQKGHVPGNKGVKGWQAGGRSAETRFRKGQRGSNWMPIGSYRINGDGYLDRKISATGYPPRDWNAVHRLVWTEANGEIPAGHSVAFKPGRRSTVLEEINLDAIELVSRAEMMRRNTIHNYPPELKQTIRLVGKLNRAIKRQAG